MKNITRSRSLAPVLNCLENRCLLSGVTAAHVSAFYGDMSMPMGASTEVMLMPTGVYKMGHLVAVNLMAMT